MTYPWFRSIVRRRKRTAGSVSAAVALTAAVLTTGCGVQSMEVPVDAGPAPSRASCVPPEDTGGSAKVYLVCDSQVEAVPRQTSTPQAGEPVALADELLTELQNPPSGVERDAGFRSSVPDDLQVVAGEAEDPVGLLRLSRHPEDLSAFALVQIICTFAQSPATDGTEGVFLGGPAEEDAKGAEPRQYQCAESLRHYPSSARANP